MAPIIWIHEDNLNPLQPCFQQYPTAPALWVWDDALPEISLKRRVFIYECLLALPVVIRRGDTSQELLTFAQEHHADTLCTAMSPSPAFVAICKALRPVLAIEILSPPPFLAYDGHLDLQRFSRYWRTAKRYAFTPTT
jgi:hypothetical protein